MISDPSQMSEPPLSEPLVLIVDDDPRIRQMISWALEDAGVDVDTAEDGQQALVRATERRPELVILDMSLPILDGYGVADGLRLAHGASLRILAITADGSAAEKARRVGAYAYLKKPFDVEDLLVAVQQGLNRR